ncbi:ribose 5-phosphate isomerase A [[Eubacterium] cellulosolvens]
MKQNQKILREACSEAIKLLKNGYSVGLGSGRTMAQTIKIIAEKTEEDRLNLSFVPSSYQIEFLARELGLKVIDFNSVKSLDLTIDGADQVELGTLNMIKGGGAALTREKIIGSNSTKVAIIIDESKLTKKLGEDMLVPIEILPFGINAVINNISEVGGVVTLRQGDGKVGPIITDNGNIIVDADFGPIDNPISLESEIKKIPGVIEVGIFSGIADFAYVAMKDEVKILQRE